MVSRGKRKSIDFYANKPRRDFIVEFAKRFASRSKAVNYLIDKGILWMKEHGEDVNPELFDHLKEAEIFQRQRDLGMVVGTKAVKRKGEKLKEIDEAVAREEMSEKEGERAKTVVIKDWSEERDIVLRRHGIRKEEKAREKAPKKKLSVEEVLTKKFGLTPEQISLGKECAENEGISLYRALQTLGLIRKRSE